MSDLGLADLTEDSGQRPSRSRGRGCLPALVALVLIAAIALFGYVKGVDLIRGVLSGPEDYAGDGHGWVVVQVTKGQTATDIAGSLYKADVVKSAQAFTDAAAADPRSGQIQTGCYRLHQQMSAESAFALMFQDSSRVPCAGDGQVTIPEGMRANEILDRVVAQTSLTRQQVTEAFAAPGSLGLPSYADGDPEGYLFPATYPVSPKTTAVGLLRHMIDTFTAKAASLGLEERAAQLAISPHDVVVVASLVQAEARRPEDMPKVASVVYNRLDVGMPLQLDSTLHYAVDSRGEVATSDNLRKLDSPYNTYTHQGLPPTAIDSPGEQALDAALNPASTSYLYFVTVNLRTGETLFASTYSQHERNVARYNRYCDTSDAC